MVCVLAVTGCSLGGAARLWERGPAAEQYYARQATLPVAAFPLKMSESRRYLVDQNNRPVFWSGDAAWSLIAQLTREDVDLYLDNRQQKGFNVILVSLIEHKFAKAAPANAYGERPFSGKVFTTPNEAYFQHADDVIAAAEKRGITVLLAPLYLGYECNWDGWCEEVKAAGEADLRAWGEYVGWRYLKYKNIVWVAGGDVDPAAYGVQAKLEVFMDALRQADPERLYTAHNAPEQMAAAPWAGRAWLGLNNVYTYQLTYLAGKEAYDHRPALPFYQIEGKYENNKNTTQQDLRGQAYWGVLSGGFGYVFGNAPVWCFSTPDCIGAHGDWKKEIDKAGSQSMQHARQLFESLAWWSLAPDWTHRVISAGYGEWGDSDYVFVGRFGRRWVPAGVVFSGAPQRDGGDERFRGRDAGRMVRPHQRDVCYGGRLAVRQPRHSPADPARAQRGRGFGLGAGLAAQQLVRYFDISIFHLPSSLTQLIEPLSF